jgi:amino acid adenylation domain-containing protein
MALHDLLGSSARNRGSHPAIIEGNGSKTLDYAGLARLSDRLRDRLSVLGVQRGDRVGMYLRKSADGVASIFGILKTGAAYVPVDPNAPAFRNAYIHNNCDVKVVLVEKRFEEAYRHELSRLGSLPRMIVLDSVGGGGSLGGALDALDAQSPAPMVTSVDSSRHDLAYILYTSGSTGNPKGVMLSHGNALSFVNWCSDTFQPQPSDIFASHAPFHFDLSILDIYLTLKHGASLVLIHDGVGKEPLGLSKLMSAHRITIWYSAPSILKLLAQFGRISEHDYSSLRMVLFAGEVFPIVHLRSFKQQVPQPRYFNLYGPTETNVCTFYEIPRVIADDRVDPYPIGKTCSNLESKVVDQEGREVTGSVEGELCIAGPNVMQGYWALPEQTARVFMPDDDSGRRWYKTGDIVLEEPDGNYRYLGRRDRMVKKRGYRVELDEIEVCLYRHAAIREAAVIAIPDEATGIKVKAHLNVESAKRLSIIELKNFCSQYLPLYMIPDIFVFHQSLPKTSTDKVDYQTLKNMA